MVMATSIRDYGQHTRHHPNFIVGASIGEKKLCLGDIPSRGSLIQDGPRITPCVRFTDMSLHIYF